MTSSISIGSRPPAPVPTSASSSSSSTPKKSVKDQISESALKIFVQLNVLFDCELARCEKMKKKDLESEGNILELRPNKKSLFFSSRGTKYLSESSLLRKLDSDLESQVEAYKRSKLKNLFEHMCLAVAQVFIDKNNGATPFLMLLDHEKINCDRLDSKELMRSRFIQNYVIREIENLPRK